MKTDVFQSVRGRIETTNNTDFKSSDSSIELIALTDGETLILAFKQAIPSLTAKGDAKPQPTQHLPDSTVKMCLLLPTET